MIYWNAKLYSTDVYYSPAKSLTSLESLDFEENCLFTIPENVGSNRTYSDNNTVPTTGLLVSENLGADGENIVAFPGPNGVFGARALGAIGVQHPFLRSNVEKVYSPTLMNHRYFYVYIPSLKRLTSIASSFLYVYSVDGDNLELISAPGIAPNGITSADDNVNNTFQYRLDNILALRGRYDSTIPLQQQSFAALSIRFDNPKNYLFIVSVNQWNQTSFNALFPMGSEPDGIGDIPPDNPYEPNGPSETGDLPPGTFDDTSDPIPDSSLPTLSAANTGFTRIYNPTLSQVQQLAKYLWTDDTVIETIWNHIKQYFEDPMQAIIGFNLVPVPVPDGGTQSFALMYIDTGVEMTVAANQFVDVDCGTLAVERYYGSALDQSPYTKITCFLPYIGQVQLDTDEVMGTTLQVKYRVDIVTGSCVAKIFVDGNCLYQYTGHCAINIPISSADFSSYVSSAISIARLATTAGLAASGVVAPPAPVTTTQQTNKTTTTNTDTARNPATGRQITMGTHTTSIINETNKEVTTSQASFDGLSPQNISNTVGQIMGSKAIVQHSGSFSGNSGYLGVRRPYLIIERPNICLPANYQQLNGYPAMITMALSSCQGYTQVQQVQLTGLTATNPEQAEILSLLKGGVIF